MRVKYFSRMIPIIALLFSLSFTPMTAVADYVQNTDTSSDQDNNDQDLKKLIEYVLNLGGYLGFHIDQTPDPVLVWSSLLRMADSPTNANIILPSVLGQLTLVSVFSATPVNAFNQVAALENFIPQNLSDRYTVINNQVNKVFPSYNAPSSGPDDKKISVITGVDQKTYQFDPVSQAVLNIIGTPDSSSCGSLSSSQCVYQQHIMSKVLADVSSDGFLPSASDFFTYDSTQKYLSQLNSNTLLAPMLYSSDTAVNSSDNGLPSASQMQQAANFIRYATGSLSPMALTDRQTYENLYAKAYPDISKGLNSDPDNPNNSTDAKDAQQSLANYLTGLRVYAAQNSVVASNLYAILGKRMPIQVGEGQPPTSQALNEYNMASWRIYNTQSKKQWVDELNNASPATVQKEIAVLLSEINYQMYLNRQQQERILLTNSLQLALALAANQPSLSDTDRTGSASDSENK